MFQLQLDLNLYLDRTLHEEFEKFCESIGQTKTVVAERAFRMYMDAMKQNQEQIMKGDEVKFLSYANFIAEAYEEAGEERSARIIRKRIDGSYKNEPQVC